MISAPAPFLLEEAGSIIPGGQLGTTKGEQLPVACLDAPLSATGFLPFSKEARLDSRSLPCEGKFRESKHTRLKGNRTRRARKNRTREPDAVFPNGGGEGS